MGDENALDPPIKCQANGVDLGGFVRGREEGEELSMGKKSHGGAHKPAPPTLSTTQDPTAIVYGGRHQYPTAIALGSRPFSTSASSDGGRTCTPTTSPLGGRQKGQILK